MRETFAALAREKKALEAQGVAPAQQGDLALARIREKDRLQRLARGVQTEPMVDDTKERWDRENNRPYWNDYDR